MVHVKPRLATYKRGNMFRGALNGFGMHTQIKMGEWWLFWLVH